MAHRVVAMKAVPIIAGGFVVCLVLFPLITVWMWAETGASLGAADWSAIRFTIWQAFLSALLSCVAAIPVARALARQRFIGRSAIIVLLSAPFILPVIVAVMGILAVFGQNGLINSVLSVIGVAPVSIYGLSGILIAHVFFNMPLVTRMILQGWLAIPAERLRLADTLGLKGWARFRVLEWPMMQQILPSAFGVVFVICLSSFAVALTLGGGPRATTLELGIYQAFRFDFDLGKAAVLALLQFGLVGVAALFTVWISSKDPFAQGLDRPIVHGTTGRFIRGIDTCVIVVAIAFLGIPMLTIFIKGLLGIISLPFSIWQAAGRSILIAAGSTLLCLGFALALARRWGEVLGSAGIAVSPLVLGAGLFLMIRPFANPFDWALIVTMILNAMLSLPFVLRILRPQAESIRTDYHRLAATMGLGPWAWVRWIYVPRLRRPIGFAAGLTAALSMGDLGVIVLFGTSDHATLPLKLYQLMGAYRMDQAAAAATVLLGLSLLSFWIFDYWGRRGAHA